MRDSSHPAMNVQGRTLAQLQPPSCSHEQGTGKLPSIQELLCHPTSAHNQEIAATDSIQSAEACYPENDGFKGHQQPPNTNTNKSLFRSSSSLLLQLPEINIQGQNPCNLPGGSLEGYSLNITKPPVSNIKRRPFGPYREAPEYHTEFNILHAFFKNPHLTVNLTRHLRVQDVLNLYCVSRNFHDIVNAQFTTVIKIQATRRAPQSAQLFPPRCYRRLCIRDPGERPHPVAEQADHGEIRTVPSFRWLKMICFREMVCHQIVVILAEDGIPLPGECIPVLKKIWLLMDIPDNARRVGLIQNRGFFTDSDLFFATLFFIKLDMRFNDPVNGLGKVGLRRMLLSQPSLSSLWKTLKRTILKSKLDVIEMFARWKHIPETEIANETVLGIPPQEIGLVQYEAWGRTTSRKLLQRPDDLVMKEAIRRGLKLHTKYSDMFLWGYIHPQTMHDISPKRMERYLPQLEGLEEELDRQDDEEHVALPKMVSTRVIQHRKEKGSLIPEYHQTDDDDEDDDYDDDDDNDVITNT